ncbi:hypothetical protein HN937_27490, partial [Candidatus Poribacteria bacterium]|nr:hypothetical protein [Candidatus Poribacteria bacterium]
VQSAQWDSLTFGVNGSEKTLSLHPLVEAPELLRHREALDASTDLPSFLAAIGCD